MKYIIHDKRYHFKSAFNTKTGAYVRTGILDDNGNDTGVDPFMASYPHLICRHYGTLYSRENRIMRKSRNRLLSKWYARGTS